jgi:hypothetical protein
VNECEAMGALTLFVLLGVTGMLIGLLALINVLRDIHKVLQDALRDSHA